MCLAFKHKDVPCDRVVDNQTDFCSRHQYLFDVEHHQSEKLGHCSGCKKCQYLVDGVGTCSKCRDRSVKRNDALREARQDAPKCKTCGYTAQPNEYCGKHQINALIEATTALGLQLCCNYVRGCREQLPLDGKKTCETCLEKNRIKDRASREPKPVVQSVVKTPILLKSNRPLTNTSIMSNSDLHVVKVPIQLQSDLPVVKIPIQLKPKSSLVAQS